MGGLGSFGGSNMNTPEPLKRGKTIDDSNINDLKFNN